MAVPSDSDVLAQVQRIAERELQYAGEIMPRHQLIADLALDSLASMTLAVGLEDYYKIRLNEADATTLKTVADVIQLVRQRVQERDGAEQR